MDTIPVGMEMFSAADEEQWAIIAPYHDYAVAQDVPVLGFVIDETATWPGNKIDSGENLAKLTSFKEKVKKKPVASWNTKQKLHSHCVTALVKAFNTRPRPGWIRAPEGSSLEVASEISRLGSENAKPREELARPPG